MRGSIGLPKPTARTADTPVHVLCVDGDASAREHLESRLDRHLDRGAVSTVASARDALVRIEDDAAAVDCVVSEYELDGMDGLALLTRVRDVDADLPFVLFTDQDSVAVASEAISAGVTDYVQKSGPDAYERLATRVADAVERTRRRRARQAAQAHFQALTENAPFAVVTVDETSTIRYANDAVADLFGYDPGELVGEPLATLMPERLRDRHAATFDRYLDTGERTLDWAWVELPGRHREGHEIPLGITFGEARHDGDRLFTGILRDVTERKQREQAVESLHEATREMVWATDRQRVADLAVEAARDMLGMPVNGIWFHDPEDDRLRPVAWTPEATEVVGEPPTFHAGEESLSWEVFETGEARMFPNLYEHRNRYNPDTPLRSEIIVPIGDHGVMNCGATEPGAFDESDVVVARLLAANTQTALDRIDRTQALRDRTEQLERQNRYLSQFYVLTTDPDTAFETKLKDTLALCCDHFGFDVGVLARIAGNTFEVVEAHAPGLPVLPGDVLGVPADAEVVPPPDAADEGVVYAAAAADETAERSPLQEEFGFEASLQVPVYVGGERHGMLVFGSPTPHDEPLGSAAVTLTKFVARWLDYELARQRARRDLERQNERLEEFASVVSHDLRNPLNAALGYLDLARTGDDEADADYLDAVERALDRMDALIEDTLTLARQGQTVEETQPVDLQTVVERAWGTVAPDGDLRVEFDDATVMADPDRLQRVFENLFRNTAEHAGPDVTVRVGLLANGRGFYAADDGPGIPEAERDAVFDHGHTTSDEGTGFGLSIVQSIVEAHGWNVDATAGEGGGARFEITGVDFD